MMNFSPQTVDYYESVPFSCIHMPDTYMHVPDSHVKYTEEKEELVNDLVWYDRSFNQVDIAAKELENFFYSLPMENLVRLHDGLKNLFSNTAITSLERTDIVKSLCGFDSAECAEIIDQANYIMQNKYTGTLVSWVIRILSDTARERREVIVNTASRLFIRAHNLKTRAHIFARVASLPSEEIKRLNVANDSETALVQSVKKHLNRELIPCSKILDICKSPIYI